MNYITGNVIRQLREKKHLTQKMLADGICVSDKTISKWETDKGFPDIAILPDLANALGVTLQELLTGEYCENDNPSANMRKISLYVCPVCGNVITSIGEGTFTCCGIVLPKLEIEDDPEATYQKEHEIIVETLDNEYFVTMEHSMTKAHYISFIAYVTTDTVTVTKLYPEQDINLRFRKRGRGYLYAYCNQHGLYRQLI